MGFESYHPAVELIFFTAAAAGSIAFSHPVFILISLFFAAAYCIKRKRISGAALCAAVLLAAVLFALYYGSVEHFGATVIGKNRIGNDLTLESHLYGLSLGARGAALVLWASCFNSVFTSDKTVYLLGRVSPRSALVLSILFRAVPRIGERARRTRRARRGIGKRRGVISAVITWMIEAFAVLSDSMRSRGAALRGRRAYSIYRFDNRDRAGVVLMFALIGSVLSGVMLGQTKMIYDPRLIAPPVRTVAVVIYGAYAAFCAIPLALETVSEIRFRRAVRSV